MSIPAASQELRHSRTTWPLTRSRAECRIAGWPTRSSRDGSRKVGNQSEFAIGVSEVGEANGRCDGAVAGREPADGSATDSQAGTILRTNTLTENVLRATKPDIANASKSTQFAQTRQFHVDAAKSIGNPIESTDADVIFEDGPPMEDEPSWRKNHPCRPNRRVLSSWR